MPALADPTVEFMDRFADESQWIIKRNVPIFKPHQRIKQDKKGADFVAYEITEGNLETIVGDVRKRESNGVPLRMTVGHIKGDPDFPESSNPEVVGYWLNARMGTFGRGQACVVADAYVKNDCREKVKGRPYRSAEYYPSRNELRGAAVMARDPALDLGTVELYALPEGAVFVPIEGELYMATETDCPDGHDQFVKHMDHYCKSQPWMKHAMETYQASAPSATDTIIPAAGAKKKKAEPEVKDEEGQAERMQRDDELATYAKLQSRVTEMEKKSEEKDKLISKLVVARDRADCERMVKQLQLEGYQLKTAPTVEKLVRKTPEARDEWVADLREHATPEPGRDMIETYAGNVEDAPAKKSTSLSPEQAATAASYAGGNPQRFEKARSCLLNGQPLND